MKCPRPNKAYMTDPKVACLTGLILPNKSMMLDKQKTHFTKYRSVSQTQKAGK